MAGANKISRESEESDDSELNEDELAEVVGGGGSGKDKIGNLNQQNLLNLQQAMDQKSQFEKVISNTLKAGSDSTIGTTTSLKSS